MNKGDTRQSCSSEHTRTHTNELPNIMIQLPEKASG